MVLNRDPIPTKAENPNGFHGRYHVTKLDGSPVGECFVLRLDDTCHDQVHVAACRQAVLCYADAIESHIPGLAADLRQRYGPRVPADDGSGHCTRCGCLLEDPRELMHECPPGFAIPVPPGKGERPGMDGPAAPNQEANDAL